MTVSLKHNFVSAIPDDPASVLAGEVVPTNWNAEHTLLQATQTLLGRSTAGPGPTEEIAIGANLTLAAGVLSATGGGGGGDVTGPASSTDNAIARFDGVTGKLIQNSLATIDDVGGLTLPYTTAATANVGQVTFLPSTGAAISFNINANGSALRVQTTPTGNSSMVFRSSGVDLAADGRISWTNGNGLPTTTIDLALGRNSAGVLEVNSGAAGNYRDIRARTFLAENGSETAPSIAFAGNLDTGLYRSAAHIWNETYAGVRQVVHTSSQIGYLQGYSLGWYSPGFAAFDIAITRGSVGVLEVNAGSPGLYRDIRLRNITQTGGTVALSTPVHNVTQTWNDGAVAFTGLFYNFTDTASAASSLIAQYQISGANRLIIEKTGGVYTQFGFSAGGTPAAGFTAQGQFQSYAGTVVKSVMNTIGFQTLNTGLLAWSSTTAANGAKDTGIGRNAAGVLEVNSGTAGTLRDLKARVGEFVAEPLLLGLHVGPVPNRAGWRSGYDGANFVANDFFFQTFATASANANATPYLNLYRSRGTMDVQTAVQVGDICGRIGFGGYDGSAADTYIEGAGLRAIVDAPLAGGLVPMKLLIATDGGSLTLNSSGLAEFTGPVGIGTAYVAGNALHVSRNITGAATSNGVRCNGAIQPDVTNAFLYRSGASVAVGTALTALTHFSASQGLNSGTITNQTGFQVVSNMVGATNNYGFVGQLTNATASTWNLYMEGNAPNYVAGSLGIGSIALTAITLRASKNITGAANAFGVVSDGAIQSDVVGNAYLFQSNLNTAAAAFNLSTVHHFSATQGTLGAGSTVGSQAGFVVAGLTGATYNYGFFGALNTGTNRYNLYMVGTADNLINGPLLLGGGALTSDPCAAVQVDSTTKGILFPRMTTAQRDAIASPTPGLCIFNTTTGKLNVRGNAAWEAITSV